MEVFDKFNAIPQYCFNCYKVLFEPRTVVELFKLMVLFEKLKLPNDNSRKCMVEAREQVAGSYKGLIYCRGLDEAKKILEIVGKAVSKEVSKKIPSTIKHGCSEFGMAYPEYLKIDKDKSTMKYKKEWQEYEDLVDQELIINNRLTISDTYNQPGYTEQDAQVMLAWLKYAATIGDLSYLKISDSTLKPFKRLKRPAPFHAAGKSKINQ